MTKVFNRDVRLSKGASLYVNEKKIINGDGNLLVSVDLGDLLDANGNEVLEFDAVTSAVNYLQARNAATGDGPAFTAQGDDTNVALNLSTKGTGTMTFWTGDSAREALILPNVASAVNEFTLKMSATGTPVEMEASGGDANIDIRLEPKGTGVMEQYSDEAGALGSVYVLRHDSASPAAADVVGRVRFDGEDSAGNQTVYSRIDSVIRDATDTTEDGDMEFLVMRAGTLTKSLVIDSDVNGIVAGDGAATGIVQSSGNFDVTLRTGNASTGEITITDGAAGQITIAPSTTGVTQVLSSDAGAVGAVFELYQNSTTPAAADVVGRLSFQGEDSTSVKTEYAKVEGVIVDATDTTEDAALKFFAMVAGTLTEMVDIRAAGVKLTQNSSLLDANDNELLKFTATGSAVNEITIANAATGAFPTISATGEADTGIDFENSEGEEILKLDAIASAVNEITIKNAATGNKPIIAATGEADTGIQFENGESEEILILDAVATAVNELTVTNAATGSNPVLSATGSDANLSIALTPKGTGGVIINGVDGGAVGSQLLLSHAGGSQANSDVVGRILVRGQDDAVAAEDYGRIDVVVTDVTAANPDSDLVFYGNVAGTLTEKLRLKSTVAGVSVGGGGSAGILQSEGNNDLTIQTGNATTSKITITDGAAGKISIAPDTTGEVELLNQDAGAVGSVLSLVHLGGSQANSDVVGRIRFDGQDAAAAVEIYGRVDMIVKDTTALNPDGIMAFYVDVAGTVTEKMRLDADLVGLQIGDGAANATLRSNGSFDLILNTGNATTGDITIEDGAAGKIILRPDTTGEVVVRSTDAGAVGSSFVLQHLGASQANSDVVGRLLVRGQDDAAAAEDYAKIDVIATDVTAANPDAAMVFYVDVAGTLTEKLRISNTISGAQIGDGAGEALLQSNGNFDLKLATGNATTGNITIVDGANGNIQLNPDGSGLVAVAAQITSTKNVGAVATGVTAVEYGDGRNHTTVLTLTNVALGTITSSTTEAFGGLIYTFPAGAHIHEVSFMSVGVTTAGAVKTDTPDVGIGSADATGASALLSTVGATAEDYITGQTAADTNGTATAAFTAATAGYGTGISLNSGGSTKTVYFNAADAWAANSGGALTATGTVVLKWTFIN